MAGSVTTDRHPTDQAGVDTGDHRGIEASVDSNLGNKQDAAGNRNNAGSYNPIDLNKDVSKQIAPVENNAENSKTEMNLTGGEKNTSRKDEEVDEADSSETVTMEDNDEDANSNVHSQTVSQGDPHYISENENEFDHVSTNRNRVVILGCWRDSPIPTLARKHAIVATIDRRDRLRTRIAYFDVFGRPIDPLVYPIRPGGGGIWCDFLATVFDVTLVGLKHSEVKKFVKIRLRNLNRHLETRHLKYERDTQAIKEAKAFIQAHPEQDQDSDRVACGLYVPDDILLAGMKRRSATARANARHTTARVTRAQSTNAQSINAQSSNTQSTNPLQVASTQSNDLPFPQPANPKLASDPSNYLPFPKAAFSQPNIDLYDRPPPEANPFPSHAGPSVRASNIMDRGQELYSMKGPINSDNGDTAAAGPPNMKNTSAAAIRRNGASFLKMPSIFDLTNGTETQNDSSNNTNKRKHTAIADGKKPAPKNAKRALNRKTAAAAAAKSASAAAPATTAGAPPGPESAGEAASAQPQWHVFQVGNMEEIAPTRSSQRITFGRAPPPSEATSAAPPATTAPTANTAAVPDAANPAQASAGDAAPEEVNEEEAQAAIAAYNNDETIKQLDVCWAKHKGQIGRRTVYHPSNAFGPSSFARSGAANVIEHDGITFERKTSGPLADKLASKGVCINIDGEDYMEYRVLAKLSF